MEIAVIIVSRFEEGVDVVALSLEEVGGLDV